MGKEGGEEKRDGTDGGKKDEEKMDATGDDDKKSEEGDVKKEDNEVFAAAEDFSDFGDSDDEILNQEEESREGGELREGDSRPGSRQSRRSDANGRKAKKTGEDRGENDQGEQQMREEAVEKANAQLADALGADWSMLVGDKSEQEAEKIGEARKRWTGAEIIRRIGLSERYLGKEKYNEVLEKINKDLPEGEKVELLHPVAGLHMARMAKREENKRLITGQQARALSARADLTIRRRLNGLRGLDPGVPLPPGNTDMQLYKQACTMLKQDQEKKAAYLDQLLAH